MSKRNKPDQKFPPGWTGSLAVPNHIYDELRSMAQWVNATPGWLDLPQSTMDDIQDQYETLLEPYLPEDMDLIDVGTGLGVGLVAQVTQVEATDDRDYRIRLRKQE